MTKFSKSAVIYRSKVSTTKVTILGVESLLSFCALFFLWCKEQNIIRVENSALKFSEFMKQKVNRFRKVLIKPISIFTEKKWLLIILTTKSYNDLWSVEISLHSPHSAITPRILTSLKFPIEINWPVELCHQLCFSDMFKRFVSLKMVKMLSKIPKYSHASDIRDIKRSKWRLTSDEAYERFK